MDYRALLVIGRNNPAQRGEMPFTLAGSGVCIHPIGVAATCLHVISGFHNRWSLPDTMSLIQQRAERGLAGHATIPVDMQRHERPYYCFSAELGFNGDSSAPKLDSWSDITCAPGIIGRGDAGHDVVVVELSHSLRRFRPLPALIPAPADPVPGGTVVMAGYTVPQSGPSDKAGHPSEWALATLRAKIVHVESSAFYVDATVQKGMSGGPVIDARDHTLLGIIVERLPARLAEEVIGIARPVTKIARVGVLLDLLDQLKSDASVRQQNGGFGFGGLQQQA